MMKLLKEPLLHFLLAGLGLFILFGIVGSDEDSYDDKVIIVDRDALLTFAQFRARAFDPGRAGTFLDNLYRKPRGAERCVRRAPRWRRR